MDKAFEELFSKFSLNFQDILDIFKTATLFAVAALLTYIVDNIDKIEMSQEALVFLPLILLILRAIIDLINKSAFKQKEKIAPIMS